MLIQGKLLSSEDDLTEALEIQRKVLVEEFGFSEEKIFDNKNSCAMHAVVYHGNDHKKAVASGKIIYDGDDCRLDNIAVLKEYRKNQYGDFIVRLLINKAFTAGIKKVYVISNIEMADFFWKIGFVQDGEEFMEEGIRKVKMSIRIENMVTKCKKSQNL
jgi:N-acetylglutamate synthase-like GNAT family acetyltransferase